MIIRRCTQPQHSIGTMTSTIRSQLHEWSICFDIFEGIFGHFENLGGEVYKACRTSDRSIFCCQYGFFDETGLRKADWLSTNLTRIESSDKLGLLDWSFTRIPRF